MGCIATENQREHRLTPEDYRLIWVKCLNLQTVVIHSKSSSFHPVFEQIDKDIDRTYPEIPQFNNPQAKQTFKMVLQNFAREFPKVGYTQGLNFVTGIFILSGFNQKQSLKCLIALCTNSNLMLMGLFQDDFPLCRLYCQLFWLVIKITNPEAHAALKESCIPDEMWIFQWFITLFTYSLPHSYLKEIFNFIIVKGLFAAVRIAVGIVQSLEKYLKVAQLKEESLIESLEYMKSQQFCHKYLPIQNILKRASKIKKNLIFNCLQECKANNFYKSYFLCVTPYRQKRYHKFLQDLNIQRKRFEQQNDVSNNTRYSREAFSMNIIDNIEQSKFKRYSKVVARSSKDRNNPFFSNLSCRRTNSFEIIVEK